MQQHKQPVNWTSPQKACGLLVAPTKQFQSYTHQPYCCSAFSLPVAMSQYCTTAKTWVVIKNLHVYEKILHSKKIHDTILMSRIQCPKES